MSNITIKYIGRKSYTETWDLQKTLVDQISNNNTSETIILVEHNPVITLGRTGNISNLLYSEDILKEKGIEFYRIERGGDITYHGLGQLVGYPILNLKRINLSLPDYLRKLEEIIIELLSVYHIQGYREPAYTGVWCDKGKLCAMGIAARKYITYHGFALNIKTDLEEFKLINPCGITTKPVASMQMMLQQEPTIADVIDQLVPILERNFG